jgi:malate dehydrogenase
MIGATRSASLSLEPRGRLVFRIASGQLLGPQTPIVLRMLDIEPALPALEGVAMELDDWAFPLLAGIFVTTNAHTEGRDGARGSPCGERKDIRSARARDRYPGGARCARAGGRESLQHQCLDRPRQRARDPLRALVRDDPTRREPSQDPTREEGWCAGRTGDESGDLGHHSATQYPDAFHARIGGQPAPDIIADDAWLRGEFISIVQQRGADIIAARKQSSAGSAAEAIMASVNAIRNGTPVGDWTSLAVVSRGEYEVPEGLQFSFPVVSDGESWRVAEGLKHDAEAEERLRVTTNELLQERALVRDLLPTA